MIGFTYPLENDTDGKIKTSGDDGTLAATWVRQYILCHRGLRPMRPTWGAGFNGLEMDPNDDVSANLMERRIRDSQKHLQIVVNPVTFERSELEEKTTVTVGVRLISDLAAQPEVVTE